jgi:predicted RNA-binding Zn-ribbon protein involved in translation (DUF1610 family)
MEEESRIEKVTHVICPNCGSNDVRYSADKQKLNCTHCDNTWDLPKNRDMILERPLGEGFSIESMPKGLGVATKVFHCEQCGSNTSIDIKQVNFRCPFCGSTKVNEEAMDVNLIKPAGILPFTFPKRKAEEQFESWIRKGWFHPNKLKNSRVTQIEGVYLPFWTYDAMTQSSWKAEAGYYYYESQTYRDANGNMQTRQVQKVRWVPASGYFEHFFDDVLVVASNGVKQADVQKIYPYPLENVVNYDGHYILGWDCEIYQKDLKGGFAVADRIMDDFIRSQCAQRIPGDTYRNLRVATQKSNLTFKHILLPLWVAGYTFNSKIFQFLVNGTTGKIAGKKPLSPWKIALTVLFFVLLILLIVFLTDEYGHG